MRECTNCKQIKSELEFKGAQCATCVSAPNQANSEEKARNKAFLTKYNITTEQRQQLFDQQNGCCAICKKHESTFKRKLAVEHDHSDGRVRGLACYYCNTRIIGKLSVKYVKSLVIYILRAYPEIIEEVQAFIENNRKR